MTMYQARIYVMKQDGADGVEGIHDRSDTTSAIRTRRKILQEKIDKAVSNLMDGFPWDTPRKED